MELVTQTADGKSFSALSVRRRKKYRERFPLQAWKNLEGSGTNVGKSASVEIRQGEKGVADGGFRSRLAFFEVSKGGRDI